MSTEYDRTVQSGRPATTEPSEHESQWATAESAAHADEHERAAAHRDHAEAAPGPRHADSLGETDSGARTSAAEQHPEPLTAADVDPHATASAADPAADSRPDAEHATAPTVETEATRAPATRDGSTVNTAEQQRSSLDGVDAALFDDTDLDRLRTQWREVQGAFVDNPREAVSQADRIVGSVIYQLTTAYAERKHVLEEHSSGLRDADTEELRQALRGYRGFFRRLLSIES